MFCLSAGATHCHNERYDGILTASTPNADKLRAYSCDENMQEEVNVQVSAIKKFNRRRHINSNMIQHANISQCLACAGVKGREGSVHGNDHRAYLNIKEQLHTDFVGVRDVMI